jgi:hypothetical protein
MNSSRFPPICFFSPLHRRQQCLISAFDPDTSGALWCRGADGVHNSRVDVYIAKSSNSDRRAWKFEFQARSCVHFELLRDSCKLSHAQHLSWNLRGPDRVVLLVHHSEDRDWYCRVEDHTSQVKLSKHLDIDILFAVGARVVQ